MNKRILAALCCITLSMGTLCAQESAPQRGNRTYGMRGAAPAPTMLADTTITNHMELSAEQLVAIGKLNDEYKEQVTAQKTGRTQDGKKVRREDRMARFEQLKTIKLQYRKQLREILGDELYIDYLEKSLDKVPAFGTMQGGMRGPQPGQRMPYGPQGGFGGPEGMSPRSGEEDF